MIGKSNSLSGNDTKPKGPVVNTDFGNPKAANSQLNTTHTAAKEPDNSSKSQIKKPNVGELLIKKINSGDSIHEAVRGIVYDAVRDFFQDETVFKRGTEIDSVKDGKQIIEEKRKELHELLDNLDTALADKNMEEASAVFSSLLNIQSQLCLQKNDGIMLIRTNMSQFFPHQDPLALRKEFRQGLTLVFSAEEIKAIRMLLPNMNDEDSLKPFFTLVLEQAYDIAQYNEITGRLLIEMSNYFIDQLAKHGYGTTPQLQEFLDRHERAKKTFDKSLAEFKEAEGVVEKHLKQRPVLQDLPNCLRTLILIRLGLVDKRLKDPTLKKIKSLLGEYSRARSATAFDFNSIASYQHAIHLRQSLVLKLQKDLLIYSKDSFQNELNSTFKEFEQLVNDIETRTQPLEVASREYDEFVKKKSDLETKIEYFRKKVDVVNSQQKMVDVQYNIISETVKRFQQEDSLYKKMEETLQNRKTAKTISTKSPSDENDRTVFSQLKG